MVGAGLKNPKQIQIDASYRLPRIDITKKNIQKIDAKSNKLVLEDGSVITYEYLVLATGLQPDYQRIPGLKEALEDPQVPVATNYEMKYAEKMNRLRNEIQSGKAIFTMPSTPIKCGGAPLKILYLCGDSWEKNKKNIDIKFICGTPTIFKVKFYADALAKEAKNYNAELDVSWELIKVDGKNKKAVFKNLQSGEEQT